MSKKNSFYLLEPFQGIPVNNPEEWLARIVGDYRRPHAAYTPQEPRKPFFKHHSDPEFSNISRVLKDISTTSVQLSLLDVLDISHEDFQNKQHTFRSRKVERLRIHQDDPVLEKALSDKDVDADIKGWKLDIFSPMYFVVGLLVTEDITYNSTESVGHKTKADVDPVKGVALTHGAAAAASPLLPSSNVGTAQDTEQSVTAKSHASGKRVFAIEYRSFRKHLRQRPGRMGKLGTYGPQGDRTFADDGGPESGEMEIVVELDPEPFSDVVEVDGEEARCITLDETSTASSDVIG